MAGINLTPEEAERILGIKPDKPKPQIDELKQAKIRTEQLKAMVQQEKLKTERLKRQKLERQTQKQQPKSDSSLAIAVGILSVFLFTFLGMITLIFTTV